MTRGQDAAAFGYQAPVLRGVWERITTFGALRHWSHAWAACCLMVGLLLLTYWGFKWLALPILVWLLGHGGLVALTTWNDRWDDMIRAQWVRKYAARYDA